MISQLLLLLLYEKREENKLQSFVKVDDGSKHS